MRDIKTTIATIPTDELIGLRVDQIEDLESLYPELREVCTDYTEALACICADNADALLDDDEIEELIDELDQDLLDAYMDA